MWGGVTPGAACCCWLWRLCVDVPPGSSSPASPPHRTPPHPTAPHRTPPHTTAHHRTPPLTPPLITAHHRTPPHTTCSTRHGGRGGVPGPCTPRSHPVSGPGQRRAVGVSPGPGHSSPPVRRTGAHEGGRHRVPSVSVRSSSPRAPSPPSPGTGAGADGVVAALRGHDPVHVWCSC
jgi:hypothetical protein